MKTAQSQTKKSRLNDQIEIIRDNPEQKKDPGSPILDDESNPLHALQELAEKLEALEDLPFSSASRTSPTPDSETSDKAARKGYMHEVDHYLDLFQKQSSVLRRLLQKLN
jgi:Zn-finger domain-containing protein